MSINDKKICASFYRRAKLPESVSASFAAGHEIFRFLTDLNVCSLRNCHLGRIWCASGRRGRNRSLTALKPGARIEPGRYNDRLSRLKLVRRDLVLDTLLLEGLILTNRWRELGIISGRWRRHTGLTVLTRRWRSILTGRRRTVVGWSVASRRRTGLDRGISRLRRLRIRLSRRGISRSWSWSNWRVKLCGFFICRIARLRPFNNIEVKSSVN